MKKSALILCVLVMMALALAMPVSAAIELDFIGDTEPLSESNAVPLASGNTLEFAGGSGTSSDPYLIATAGHLNNVRNYKSSHFRMIADIVFTEEDFAAGGAYYNNGSGWEPLFGVSEFVPEDKNRFYGTFDGNGHTITGLHINSKENRCVGLFGFNEGTIKNLGMIDSVIIADGGNAQIYVGGIVGYNRYKIENCYHTGTITAKSSISSGTRVGGIVGENAGGSITECYNTGSLRGEANVGGIVGYHYYNTYAKDDGGVLGTGTILRCYNSGNVTSKDNSGVNAGGIAGYSYGGYIYDSYNTGTILANNDSYNSASRACGGGIVGEILVANRFPLEISRCFNVGSVSAQVVHEGSVANIGGILGTNYNASIHNCYYLADDAYTSNIGTSCTDEALKTEETYVNFDFDSTWCFSSRSPYPQLLALIPQNTTEFLRGIGTEKDPYLIATATHLDNVRHYPDAYFKLTKDIVFDNADFALGGAFHNSGAGWKPIGADDENAFTGVFDGDGHTISGLYVNDDSGHTGLFGCSSGIIKNLGLVDGKVCSTLTSGESLYLYCGGIVGLSSGSVLNCYFTGSVDAKMALLDDVYVYCGGVAGSNDGTMKDCYNSGKVNAQADYGWAYAGGVAGKNNYSELVENSYNTGEITSVSDSGDSSAAGIVGSNLGKISNCYNEGNVTAGQFAAGISEGGEVISCYNKGTITSDEHAGGIIAYSSRSSVSLCYNEGAVWGGNAGGIAGFLEQGTVINCYNSGDISVSESASTTNIGGVVGWNYNGTVNYCYNVGEFSPKESSSYYSKFVGGIVGKNGTNSKTGIVKNSYYLDHVTYLVGSGTSSTGKLSAKEMELESSFATFDFNDVWCMDPISGYPYPQLAWQVKEISEISFTEDSSLSVESVEGLAPELDAEIKITYVDGTFVVVPLEFSMLPDFDKDSVGTQVLNVCYRDVISKDTITIHAAERSLQGIEMKALPRKTTYVKDFEVLDVSGGVVSLIYNNGTTETTDLAHDMIQSFNSGTEGKQKVTVSYKGFTTDFYVYGVTCESIEVDTMPVQVIYESGQPIDLSGGKIKVHYSNGSSELVDLKNAEISYDKDALGTVGVTGTLYDTTFCFDITVTPKKIDSIVVTAPKKVTYVVGQDMDLFGGALLVNYSSSYNAPEIFDLSMDMISGYDKDSVGTYLVTVSYGGKTDTFEVNVIPKKVVSIAVSEIPTHFTHAENEMVSMIGGKITARYNDDTEKIVDITGAMLSGYDAKEVGTQSFTVTYEGNTASFEAEVEHNYYDHEVFAPNCKERGYTFYSCYCGNHLEDDYVDALGHDPEIDPAVAPTCTETGLTEGSHCSRCTEEIVGQKVVPALGHDMIIDEVAVAPTCTESGWTESKHCRRCEDATIVKQEIPALGHKYDAVVTAPTCEEDGYTTYTCHCGDTYVADEVTAKGHKYDAVVTAPTCEEGGYTTYTCHCGDTYVADEVAATGHNYNTVVIEPTCTAKGYTSHTCHCGNSYTDNEVAAKGHRWDSGTVTVQPGPVTEGEKLFKCLNGCGETYIGSIPATGIEPPNFADVKVGAYYYDAVAWAVGKGITIGTSDTTFSPDKTCTRGEAVTFLWRAAGKPAPKSSRHSFTDIKASAYYYDAVLWAVENGITVGTGGDKFSPDMVCSRSQIVTFLHRAAGEPKSKMTSRFLDVPSDSFYFEAVSWAVENGITVGTGGNKFSPDMDCNRGQIVTFLYRAEN